MSILWNHFEKDQSTKLAKCNYCHGQFSYKTTITNLKYHLSTKHRDVHDALEEQKISARLNTAAVFSINSSNETQQKYDRTSHNILWNYFERDCVTRTAQCIVCKKTMSYKTTITNLKIHLQKQHRSIYEQYLNGLNSKSQSKKKIKKKICFEFDDNPVWTFFEKDPTSSVKIADCNICHKSLLFTSSTANLKQHLKFKHLEDFNKLQALYRSYRESQSDDYDSQDQSEEDPEESLKISDIWSYFEEESDGRAPCVVCRKEVICEYEDLKAHLKEDHPNLLLQIMQNKESPSDAASNGADDDNTFTEVVYLEQDALADDVSTPRDITVKTTQKKKPRFVIKRERRNSSEEIPVKRRHSTFDEIPRKQHRFSEQTPRKNQNIDDENDELTSFIKYITCLLKKLSPDAFSKVQVDIINTILKANRTPTSDNSRIILNNEFAQTSVPNVLTVSDSALLGHNYTITVATKDGELKSNETETTT